MALDFATAVLREYPLAFSGDPAFRHPDTVPPPLPGEHEDPEAFGARLDEWKDDMMKRGGEFAQAFMRCTEQQDWSPLLVEGRLPTVFRVRQVSGSMWRAFQGFAVRHRLLDRECAALAFRLAVVRIEDQHAGVISDKEVHREPSGQASALGEVLAASVVDRLDAIDKLIVDELGQAVLKQRGAPLGK
jgi:hypothetical protein